MKMKMSNGSTIQLSGSDSDDKLQSSFDPMTAAPDLLPCPFCSGEAKQVAGISGHYVVCDEADCHCSTPYSSDEATAIEAWNRRATPAPQAATYAGVSVYELMNRAGDLLRHPNMKGPIAFNSINGERKSAEWIGETLQAYAKTLGAPQAASADRPQWSQDVIDFDQILALAKNWCVVVDSSGPYKFNGEGDVVRFARAVIQTYNAALAATPDAILPGTYDNVQDLSKALRADAPPKADGKTAQGQEQTMNTIEQLEQILRSIVGSHTKHDGEHFACYELFNTHGQGVRFNLFNGKVQSIAKLESQ